MNGIIAFIDNNSNDNDLLESEEVNTSNVITERPGTNSESNEDDAIGESEEESINDGEGTDDNGEDGEEIGTIRENDQGELELNVDVPIIVSLNDDQFDAFITYMEIVSESNNEVIESNVVLDDVEILQKLEQIELQGHMLNTFWIPLILIVGGMWWFFKQFLGK